MSRCGSTLITQMLNSNKKFFSISEPPIVNKILDPKVGLSSKTRNLLLKTSIESIARSAPEESNFTVIKFRSWNVFFLEKILKNFNKTPWLFVHRDGIEVLSSVIKKPPGWLRSKENYADFFANCLKINKVDLLKTSNDEFIARMLGAFCNIAQKSISKYKYVVDYKYLPERFFEF